MFLLFYKVEDDYILFKNLDNFEKAVGGKLCTVCVKIKVKSSLFLNLLDMYARLFL